MYFDANDGESLPEGEEVLDLLLASLQADVLDVDSRSHVVWWVFVN